MFKQRCDKQIYNKIGKIDRVTAENVYHVSEFMAEIHESMLETESKWCAQPTYMSNQQKINE